MDRREFLSGAGAMLGVLGSSRLLGPPGAEVAESPSVPLTLVLCGDVMTGRGIDQVMPHPSDPTLHEPYVQDARRYVELAETANGPIPQRVEPTYIWGDVLLELDRLRSSVRIVNLETAITRSNEAWAGKGIHYRMHPENIGCLAAAEIDCCTLANNHTLDWGYRGLTETLETLDRAAIRRAGAGHDRREAIQPAVFDLGDTRRLLVFSVGLGSSGIPPDWVATTRRPGLNLLPKITDAAVSGLARELESQRQPGDLVVLSIHWGGNWGYQISQAQQLLAHRLIDEADVSVVHGHSSHHPKGIEVYRDALVLYGCGDFLNDYEGIGGYGRFRPDLTLLYLLTIDPETVRPVRLRMVPFRIRRFRLERVGHGEAEWLRQTLTRASPWLDTEITILEDGSLALEP